MRYTIKVMMTIYYSDRARKASHQKQSIKVSLDCHTHTRISTHNRVFPFAVDAQRRAIILSPLRHTHTHTHQIRTSLWQELLRVKYIYKVYENGATKANAPKHTKYKPPHTTKKRRHLWPSDLCGCATNNLLLSKFGRSRLSLHVAPFISPLWHRTRGSEVV